MGRYISKYIIVACVIICCIVRSSVVRGYVFLVPPTSQLIEQSIAEDLSENHHPVVHGAPHEATAHAGMHSLRRSLAIFWLICAGFIGLLQGCGVVSEDQPLLNAFSVLIDDAIGSDEPAMYDPSYTGPPPTLEDALYDWKAAKAYLLLQGYSRILTVHGNMQIKIYDTWPEEYSYLRFSEKEIDIIRDTIQKMLPHTIKVKKIFTLPETAPAFNNAAAGFVPGGSTDEFMLYMVPVETPGIIEHPESARIIVGQHDIQNYIPDRKTDAALKFISNNHGFLAQTVLHEILHLRDNEFKSKWVNLHEASGEDLDNFACLPRGYTLEYMSCIDDAYLTKNWREDRAGTGEMLAIYSVLQLDYALDILQEGKEWHFRKLLESFAETFILPGQRKIQLFLPLKESVLMPFVWDLHISEDRSVIDIGPYLRLYVDENMSSIVEFERYEFEGEIRGSMIDAHVLEVPIEASSFITAVEELYNTAVPQKQATLETDNLKVIIDQDLQNSPHIQTSL